MPRGRPRKNPNDVLIKSAEFIGWALGGLEREILETRQRLASLTAQANQLRTRIGARKGGRPAPAGTSSPVDIAATAAAAAPKRRRRKMSPEARRRMSEMMKKRWAERKKGSK